MEQLSIPHTAPLPYLSPSWQGLDPLALPPTQSHSIQLIQLCPVPQGPSPVIHSFGFQISPIPKFRHFHNRSKDRKKCITTLNLSQDL